MPSLMFSMIFAFLYLSSSLFSFTGAANPTYLSSPCQNTNFTRNSTYQTNLNRLLSSLPSYANSSNGFHNATSGQDPNRVYGLFQCRGDISAATCQSCVTFATRDITERCPVAKEAVIWYDEFLLRYSDNLFFSTVADKPSLVLMNTNNVIEADRFSRLLWSLMSPAATEAANSPNKFATKKGNLSEFQNLYCLVGCTQDLSSSDCTRCLQISIGNLPTGKIGGRAVFPSCYSRFEIYPFYIEKPPTTEPPPSGPLIRPKENNRISSSIIIAIVASSILAVVLFIIGCRFLSRRKMKYNFVQGEIGKLDEVGNDNTTVESLQVDFETIQAATNGFSANNKLDEGGFGEVYKGKFSNGQEIAVKRLSRRSKQGAEEFKNEIRLVAKLQHRNLVRLLGFCLEGEEKILIYEFMPNKSLDHFLYDSEKQGQLDWSRRYKILGGIARGILYLHEDSQLKIIHRNLKVNNILLDSVMNPKISNFGMARIFEVNQSQGNTSRIVGTYGYMVPEYAGYGHFSVKSDAYSFGVIVLEIITGKKNSNFNSTDGAEDLLSYAWKHWREGTPMEMLDSNLTDSYSRNEVMRCIHVGLLCVQEDPAERPTMATVVLMLNSYSVTLPLPQQPAFFHGSRAKLNLYITKGTDSDKSASKSMPWSVDDASITEVYPR